MLFRDPKSRSPVRRGRRARLGLEPLEDRRTPTTSLSFASPLSLVLLNPQPLPPGSIPAAISYPPNPCVYYPPPF